MVRTWRVLAFLGAVWTCVDGLCPLECNCAVQDVVNCSGLAFDSFPSGIETHVTIMDLSNNSFKNIYFFNHEHMQYLNLSHNFISEASSLYLPRLTHLDLSYNHISNVHKLPISQFPLLTSLNLSWNARINELKIIESYSLEVLDLSCTNLDRFAKRSLSKMTNLKSLIVSNTSISILNNLESSSLSHLDVRNCEVTHIGVDTMMKLPNLTFLDASQNENLQISLHGPCINSLQTVYFSDCRLHSAILDGLCQVEDLRLDRNSIDRITDHTLSNSIILKYLNLSNNNLLAISKLAFANVTQLRSLDVSKNRLPDIGWTKVLRNIRILNVSSNEISLIHDLDLPLVLHLDFSYNRISDFSVTLKKALPTVEYLNLRGNLIERIQPMESETLKNLRLGYCQISILEKDTFKKLINLNFLDLEGNKLKRLNYQTLSLIPKLTDVRLGHNPWSCDCKNTQFRNLFNYILVNKTLEANPDNLRCDEIKKSWLEACAPDNSENTPERVLYIVAGFFVLALLAIGALIYCKSKQIRNRMEEETLHQQYIPTSEIVDIPPPPFRRAHSEAEVYARPPQPSSMPPPSYEEALLLPPLSETERMTRSMGVLHSI